MLTFLAGLGYVGGAVALAIVGSLLARRYLPQDVLVQHHDISSVFFQVIGTFYAVLLGFVVLVVWNAYSSTKLIVAREANLVGAVYRYAQPFPDPGRQELQSAVIAYAEAVIEDEWPLLAEGRSSPRALAFLATAWQRAFALDASNPDLIQIKPILLQRIDDLDDNRAQRINAAKPTISAFLWTLLAVGGLLVLGFSYLFRVRARGSQFVLCAALAAVIALLVFLIAELDQPFSGEVKLNPTPFQFELDEIRSDG